MVDSETYIPSKEPMRRKKPHKSSEEQNSKKFKGDKRKQREAFERKRGG